MQAEIQHNMYANQLTENEYPSYYTDWIAELSNEYNLVESLEIACHTWIHFVQNVPWDKLDYRYAPGKWTIKEITQHLIDCERIFTYRALSMARGEQSVFMPFDQEAYQAQAGGEGRHLQSLLEEFSLVRHSTLALFKSLSAEQLERKGKVGQHEMTVRGIGFMLLAHQQHHQNVYQTRYIHSSEETTWGIP